MANQYVIIGDSILASRTNFDSSIQYFTKAAELYEKDQLWTKYFTCQNLLGSEDIVESIANGEKGIKEHKDIDVK